MTDRSDVLLTCAQMGEADRLTVAAGLDGPALMGRAGAAVADEIIRRYPTCPVAVLCGPGNNGGDGFVVATLLARAGWPVRLGLLGDCAKLAGDAAHHAALWLGPVEPLSSLLAEGAGVVVDALFGSNLSRPVPEAARTVLLAAQRMGAAIVAIDVPSGVAGDSGADLGAVSAVLTVTFFRKKPGHLLLPGRRLCGDVVVADIGIAEAVLAAIAPACFENTPALWRAQLPAAAADSHKYTRGHALIVGGAVMTGAARMAARAAARAGAGLTSIAVPESAWPIYAATLTSIMVRPLANDAALAPLLADTRISAMLVGPGAGVGPSTRGHALTMLATGRPVLLDADALSVFAPDTAALFAAVSGPCVLTPHEGEFARLFPGVPCPGGGPAERCRCRVERGGHRSGRTGRPSRDQRERAAQPGYRWIGRRIERLHRRPAGAGHASVGGGLRRGLDARGRGSHVWPGIAGRRSGGFAAGSVAGSEGSGRVRNNP